MEHRGEQIILETERHRISGILRLPRDGYRSRLTDYLNGSERGFIPLTNVEIERLDGTGGVSRRPFAVISISRIVVAFPAEESESE